MMMVKNQMSKDQAFDGAILAISIIIIAGYML